MTKIVENDQKSVPIQDWTDDKKRTYIRKGERRGDYLSWLEDAKTSKQRYFLVFISSIGDCIFSGYPQSWIKTAKDIKKVLKRSSAHKFNGGNTDINYCFVVMNVSVENRINKKIKIKIKKKKEKKKKR
jgi:hypothetical protein